MADGEVRQVKLKACYVLSPNLSFRGGAKYDVTEYEETREEEKERSRWRTDKVVFDRAEYDKGRALKEQIRRKLYALGVPNEMGVVIPMEKPGSPGLQVSSGAIDEVVTECKAIVREYNGQARFSKLSFYPVLFKVEDQMAGEAIAAALAEKLADVSKALQAGNVKEVRQLLRDTDNYAELFEGDVAGKVSAAWEAARGEAKRLAAAAREFERTAQRVEVEVRTAPIDIARACFIEALSAESRGVSAITVDIAAVASIEAREVQVGKSAVVTSGVESTLFM